MSELIAIELRRGEIVARATVDLALVERVAEGHIDATHHLTSAIRDLAVIVARSPVRVLTGAI